MSDNLQVCKRYHQIKNCDDSLLMRSTAVLFGVDGSTRETEVTTWKQALVFLNDNYEYCCGKGTIVIEARQSTEVSWLYFDELVLELGD